MIDFFRLTQRMTNQEFLARTDDDGELLFSAEAIRGGPKPAWLLPKIHNSPNCLSGRHGR